MTTQFNSIGRRRKERVTARKGALAFNGSRYGQIIDCSLAELCFLYRGDHNAVVLRKGDNATAADNLDIVFQAHEFALIDLPVATVADYPLFTMQPNETGYVIRCRHITFGQLNLDQWSALKRFLQLNRFGIPIHEIGPVKDLAARGNLC